MVPVCFLLALFVVSLPPLITAKDIGCEPIPKQDFSEAGRRLSEEKCYEYNRMWRNLQKCSKESTNMEYPYVGAMGYDKKDRGWTFFCGASLISPKFALTTGVCATAVHRDALGPITVRFGNTNIKDDVPRVEAKVLRMIPYPDHKPETGTDIAILEFEEDLPLSKSLFPGCLWGTHEHGMEVANNPTWGVEKDKGLHYDVQNMQLKLIDCKAEFENRPSAYSASGDRLICVDESVSPVLICTGAAGSPLVTEGKMEDGHSMPYFLGISSAGQGCGKVGYYTRISSYMDWIEENVWPKSEA